MLAKAAHRTDRRPAARWVRLVVGAAVALVVLLVTAEPASAHTDLESSVPADGATVEAPTQVQLRFTEPIELAASEIWLGDVAGAETLEPVAHIDGDEATLAAALPPLAPGQYEVSYHVLAADGTPAHGVVRFTVPTPTGTPAPPAAGPTDDPAADPRPDESAAIAVDESGRRPGSVLAPEAGDADAHGPSGSLNAFARGLLNASLATLVGGLAFVATVWPQGARLVRTRQVLWMAALLAAVASFELVAFQHATAAGLETLEALSPASQWDALSFRFGRIAAVRVVLLAASAVLTARLARGGARTARSVGWSSAAVAVALGLSETVALLGHSTESGVVSTATRLVHVVAVSTWIGGLVMLLFVVLPRRRVEELVTVLPRFSALASVAVVVLTVGGVLLAVDLVGTAEALPTTGYGRMLLAKIAIVAALLAVAARSRRHVRTALLAREGAASESVVRPLALWVTTEVGLVGLVLALTALLVTRVPPG